MNICEKCCRVTEKNTCPACGCKKVREVGEKDPVYLTELDYLSSGILKDVLKQNEIPFLVKDVMGAGMAIKVGPMLDRSRFYVPYPQLESAGALVSELFPDPEEGGEA